MKEWIESLADNSEKRAVTSVWVGIASILFGFGTFLFVLAYPISAFLGLMGMLMAYTSLESKRGWHAVIGLALSGIGMLAPLAILAFSLFFLK